MRTRDSDGSSPRKDDDCYGNRGSTHEIHGSSERLGAGKGGLRAARSYGCTKDLPATDSSRRTLPTLARMRTFGIAAAIAAGVVAGGFGLQWIGLPRAGRGDVVAARAALWLARYREASSEVTIGRRHVHATCVRRWVETRSGRLRRGTLLRLETGGTIRDVPPHTLLIDGLTTSRPVAMLLAAGCTKVLGDRLATLAQFDGGVRARRVYLGDVNALAVRFPYLTLYVDRASGQPIGVTNPWAQGRFHLVPLFHRRD